MNERKLWKYTGLLGIGLMILTLIEVPLYFIYDGPPPDGNILARVLLNVLVVTGLVIFFASFRGLVAKSYAAYEWLATLMFGGVLAYALLTFIASSLEAGLAIATSANIDPTIAANGTYIMYGSIGRLMSTLLLGSAGYLTFATRILPRWTSWLAFYLAAFSLAFVPSMFFGNDPTHFYSANGWGTTAIAASSLMYWVLAASIVMLVKARKIRA